MRKSLAASTAILLAAVAFVATGKNVGAQRRPVPEGFISEGIPKRPNPPGPAPKRDLSGAWVGPGTSNKPEPVPPMTAAGQAAFKQHKGYSDATRLAGKGDPGESNDPFITCDPLGFPRNLEAH